MTVDAATLRSVLRAHASGVAVLTAAGPTGPAGVTITSFVSLSAEPALVSFALAVTSSTWAQIADARWYGVHVLSADQGGLAERFATKDAARFAPPTCWRPGPHGVPLLEGCLARLVCSRHELVRAGDHHLVIASVESAERGAPGESLVHLHGALHAVGAAAPARL